MHYLRHQSPLPLVGDVLVVAAVELLHAGQELLGRHAAHHGRDPVDHGEPVLGPGHGEVRQRDPLLKRPVSNINLKRYWLKPVSGWRRTPLRQERSR